MQKAGILHFSYNHTKDDSPKGVYLESKLNIYKEIRRAKKAV